MRILLAGALSATLLLCAQSQETPAVLGIPPRAAPSDYQVSAKAGPVTIAAEFLGHSIPSDQGSLIAEEYVVVEAAVFGPAGARATLAATDFTLRINNRKVELTGAHFGLVFASLKDPDWGPSEAEKKGSKTSVGGSGGGRNPGDPPPPPPKMPIGLRRAMEQRVQKAALPEGDRPLPQAGLLFFQYRGKTDGIHQVELTYNGKDGKAKLTLQ
ncbi:MAG: hypothetical protein JST93_22115 [Acidobacteria bacterium]|nr:hypothetical protein [Acidobacteriota bacterium]